MHSVAKGELAMLVILRAMSVFIIIIEQIQYLLITYSISPSSAADQMRCGLSGAVASLLTLPQWQAHSSNAASPYTVRARTVLSAAQVAITSGVKN